MGENYVAIGNSSSKVEYTDFKKFVQNEILFAYEVADLLHVTKQHVNNLVHQGKLIPIKRTRAGNLFLKKDIDDYIFRKSYHKTIYDAGAENTLYNYIIYQINNGKDNEHIINNLVEIFNLEYEAAQTMVITAHTQNI